ncbi:MAG: glycosyltransferase [Nitrosopumilus sp.]|nr:glycosyltransferase [Nitrosopumilus sp.]
MNSQRVSVIIPVYNSEKFLKESIESIIHQTYSDVEIIAVNDGSTDGSLEILQQYEDKIFIIDQKNMGLAEAVNAGIKKMSGHWLKWLSPDDVLYPNAIEILVDNAKKLPENTLVYSDWEMIDKIGNKIRNFSESNYNRLNNFEFGVRLLDGQQVNINTSLIPSSIIKKCLMKNLDDMSLIDYDFFLKCSILYNVNFFLVKKILLKYRIHKNQSSHKNIINSLIYQNKIRDDILSHLDDDTKTMYEKEIKNYQKNKTTSKKFMELGLKLCQLFPVWLSDKLLNFYLNQIRSSR